MKKISLSILAAFAVFSIFLFTGCKKSSSDDTTTTTIVLSATVNGSTWEPDTLSANINYNAATKTKTFSFVGTNGQKRITGTVILANATNTNTFTIGSNSIDATGNTSLLYSVQKNSNGNYIFVPYVAAAAGDGYINVSAIDPVGNTITGSFAFTHKTINYDSSGNITSVVNTVIAGGTFTTMPYTFTSN